jgi:hypothetical protein
MVLHFFLSKNYGLAGAISFGEVIKIENFLKQSYRLRKSDYFFEMKLASCYSSRI